MATRYSSPADQPIMNTYVPLPFDEMYKLAGKIDTRRKETTELMNESFDNLLEAEFIPNTQDQATVEGLVGEAQDLIEGYSQQGVDLADPQVYDQVRRDMRRLAKDPRLARAKQSADEWKKYEAIKRQLVATGKYHHSLDISPEQLAAHNSEDGIFNRYLAGLENRFPYTSSLMELEDQTLSIDRNTGIYTQGVSDAMVRRRAAEMAPGFARSGVGQAWVTSWRYDNGNPLVDDGQGGQRELTDAEIAEKMLYEDGKGQINYEQKYNKGFDGSQGGGGIGGGLDNPGLRNIQDAATPPGVLLNALGVKQDDEGYWNGMSISDSDVVDFGVVPNIQISNEEVLAKQGLKDYQEERARIRSSMLDGAGNKNITTAQRSIFGSAAIPANPQYANRIVGKIRGILEKMGKTRVDINEFIKANIPNDFDKRSAQRISGVENPIIAISPNSERPNTSTIQSSLGTKYAGTEEEQLKQILGIRENGEITNPKAFMNGASYMLEWSDNLPNQESISRANKIRNRIDSKFAYADGIKEDILALTKIDISNAQDMTTLQGKFADYGEEKVAGMGQAMKGLKNIPGVKFQIDKTGNNKINVGNNIYVKGTALIPKDRFRYVMDKAGYPSDDDYFEDLGITNEYEDEFKDLLNNTGHAPHIIGDQEYVTIPIMKKIAADETTMLSINKDMLGTSNQTREAQTLQVAQYKASAAIKRVESAARAQGRGMEEQLNRMVEEQIELIQESNIDDANKEKQINTLNAYRNAPNSYAKILGIIALTLNDKDFLGPQQQRLFLTNPNQLISR